MTRASEPQTGHASSMSSATPAAFLSAMSMTTTSASCLSATPRATVAPTLPAPPTTVTLRFMSAPLDHDQRGDRRDRRENPTVVFSVGSAISALYVFYILLMMVSPKSDVDSSVAPSMSRAKSYVTRLVEMAPSMPLTTRSAASTQPR